jgi:hypothetical protein
MLRLALASTRHARSQNGRCRIYAGDYRRPKNASGRLSDEAGWAPIAGCEDNILARLNEGQSNLLGIDDPLEEAGLRGDQYRELQTGQALAYGAVGIGVLPARQRNTCVVSRCRVAVADNGEIYAQRCRAPMRRQA